MPRAPLQVEVVQIQYVHNPTLLSKFESKRQELRAYQSLQRSHGGGVRGMGSLGVMGNMSAVSHNLEECKVLWHGTGSMSPEEICTGVGIDDRFSAEDNYLGAGACAKCVELHSMLGRVRCETTSDRPSF